MPKNLSFNEKKEREKKEKFLLFQTLVQNKLLLETSVTRKKSPKLPKNYFH